MKAVKELHKLTQPQPGCSGSWPQNKVCALDKSVGEIKRILDKEVLIFSLSLILASREWFPERRVETGS